MTHKAEAKTHKAEAKTHKAEAKTHKAKTHKARRLGFLASRSRPGLKA